MRVLRSRDLNRTHCSSTEKLASAVQPSRAKSRSTSVIWERRKAWFCFARSRHAPIPKYLFLLYKSAIIILSGEENKERNKRRNEFDQTDEFPEVINPANNTHTQGVPQKNRTPKYRDCYKVLLSMDWKEEKKWQITMHERWRNTQVIQHSDVTRLQWEVRFYLFIKII